MHVKRTETQKIWCNGNLIKTFFMEKPELVKITMSYASNTRKQMPMCSLSIWGLSYRSFLVHNYVVWFHNEQYRFCLTTFPQDSILLVVDFAKNYTFQEFNENQYMHWHSFHISILVHIYYRWNPNFVANPNWGEKKLLTDYHYYISNDNEHDPLFVQHCFQLHWSHLTTRGFYLNEHLVRSNKWAM